MAVKRLTSAYQTSDSLIFEHQRMAEFHERELQFIKACKEHPFPTSPNPSDIWEWINSLPGFILLDAKEPEQ